MPVNLQRVGGAGADANDVTTSIRIPDGKTLTFETPSDGFAADDLTNAEAQAKTLIYSAATQNFVFEGDSNTAGASQWADRAILLPAFAGRGTGYNVATAGHNLANIVADYATQVYPRRPTGSVASAWLFVLIGTNDILTTTYAAWTASWDAYITTALTDLFKVVAMTIPPRGDISGTQEIIRRQINTYIRNRAGLAGVIDVASIFPNIEDTTVWSTDGVHLNSVGSELLAREANAFLLSPVDSARPSVALAERVRLSPSRQRGGLNLSGVIGQNIVADPAGHISIAEGSSVSWGVRHTTDNKPTVQGLWAMSPGAAVTAFHVTGAIYAIETNNGSLIVRRVGATAGTLNGSNGTVTSGDYRQIAAQMGPYRGKDVLWTWTVTSAGTVALYANGVAVRTTETTLGTPPAWADALTPQTVSAATLNNSVNASQSDTWWGPYWHIGFWNLALSATEAEMFSRGGFSELPDLQWGAGTELITNGTFAADTNWSKGSGVTISGDNLNFASVAVDAGANQSSLSLARGKRHRHAVTLSSYTSGTLKIAQSSYVISTFTPAVGLNVVEAISLHETAGHSIISGTIGTTLAIDTYSAKRIGCVLGSWFADGVGSTARDISTNARNLTITASAAPIWMGSPVVASTLVTTEVLTLSNATASTSTTTGALVATGGIATAGRVWGADGSFVTSLDLGSAASTGLNFRPSVSEHADNSGSARIAYSGGAGSDFSGESGNLVLQPRTSLVRGVIIGGSTTAAPTVVSTIATFRDGALAVTGNLSATGTINGNTITTGTGTLTLGAGKTLTASNTLTLTATDGSTLAIGTGGTLGTAAYTSAGAYATAAQGTTADAAAPAVGAADIEITDATKGVVLKSPDGSRWRISVSDLGVLSTTEL